MAREGMAATPWGTGEPCVCASQAVSSRLAEEPLPSKKIAGIWPHAHLSCKQKKEL